MSDKTIGSIDGIEVMITDHALERMLEMGLCASQVRNLVSDPDEVVDSVKYPGTKIHRVGRHSIAVAKRHDKLVIITCLYSSQESWEEANRKGRMGKGRSPRMRGRSSR